MTPKPPPSVVPAPPNYAVPEFSFPNAIPGRQPPHSDFVLWPEVTPQGFPVTPPIPPTVQTGDVITAGHENTVSTAINDLWIDLQSLGSTTITDPTQAQGDLIARTTTALTRLIVGANGTLLTADNTQATGLRWATVASTGAVPSTRQVLAGVGMSGGGALSADVTLTAKVFLASGASHAIGAVPDPGASAGSTRYLREDATWVAPPGGFLDPTTTKGDVIARGTAAPATRLGVGADKTILTADSTQATGIKWAVPAVMGASGASHAAGAAPDPGATTGATRYLREDATWAIPAGAGGGLTDPTTTKGDLMARSAAAITRLGVGTDGQVLTADAAQTLGLKWAAPAAVGVPTSRMINTTAPTLTGGDLTNDLTLTVMADTIVQQTRTSYNGTLVGTRREVNFIPGTNVSLLVADDTPNNRVNITISSTAVGGAQTPWTSDINANGFMLYSASKVGIGIASPQAPLHVASSSVTTGMIETTAASGGLALLNLKTATSLWQVAAGGAASALPGCWYIYDQTGAGTRLVIGPSGNVGVGVGTNVPASLLQVGQGSPLAAGIADFYGPNRNIGQSPHLNIYSTDAMALDKGGSLGLGGVGGAANPFTFAYLAGRSENNAYAGYFHISTPNSAGVMTEKMRVTSAGAVGIGRGGPQADFHLYRSGTYAQMKVESNTSGDSGIIIADSVRAYKLGINIAGAGAGQFQLWNVTAGAALLSGTDNRVGIFKASPGYTLDVNGDVNSAGVVRVGGAQLCWSSGVGASGGLVLGAQADVPGLTVTVPYSGRYLVLASCQVLNTGDVNNLARIYLISGGSQSPYVGDFGTGASSGSQGTVTMMWHTIASAGAIIKIQGARISGSGCQITSNSTLAVHWVQAN